MELAAAPTVSVPAVSIKSGVSFSPCNVRRSAWIIAGQGREPHCQFCRLHGKNSVSQRIFINNALWQAPEFVAHPAKQKLRTGTLRSINASMSFSEALLDVRQYLYESYLLKCCMQRHNFPGIAVNVFQKNYGYASSLSGFEKSFNSIKARSSRLGSKQRRTPCIPMSGIAEIGNTITINWRPAVEEILLVSSIALAYIAGIASPGKNSHKPFFGNFRRKEGSRVEESTPAFDDAKSIQDNKQHWESSFSANRMWGRLQQKLEDAAIKVEGEDIGNFRPRKNSIAMDLYLQAIYPAPRLRLMLSTLDHLRKEIGRFAERNLPTERRVFSEEVLDCVCSCIAPALQSWLSQEHCLIKAEHETSQNEAFAGIVASFDQSYFYNYLERTGKAQLYADFFFFVFHNSIRSGSCCSHKSFIKHAEGIMEDIVITVAEGATEQYLSLLSNNAIDFDDSEWPSTLLPAIVSTRSLQSFLNQVALRSWFHENFECVAAIYEDRMELRMLQDAPAAGNVGIKKSQKKRLGLLEQDAEKYDGAKIVVAQYSMPMKRIKELQTLSGWRYYYSLYLEFIDIAGPMLKIVVSKLGEGISFLLVCLIGRSLGLIYQGIRQSIQWGSK